MANTAGPLTLRETKGSALEYQEVDDNFAYLEALAGGQYGTNYSFTEVDASTNKLVGVADVAYLAASDSATLTINLPDSATLGNRIFVIDAGGNANANPITIKPETSSKIMGSTTSIVISQDGDSREFVYYNTSRGWIVIGGTTNITSML